MTALTDSKLPAFSHMIYPYAGTGQYLSGTLAYIDRARQAGATVVIAAPENRRADFGAQLPDDERVIFMDITAIGRNPGRLIPAWREWIGQKAATGVVHGINEPTWTARSPAHQREARYEEWLLNLAFAQAPAWSLLCPVDTAGNRPETIEALTRCHPLVWNGTDGVASTDYLANAFDLDDLPEPPPTATRTTYTVDNLAELRDEVFNWASATVPTKRARDLTLSVSEIATNSIRHGGGAGKLALWREDGALVCDLRDHGVISDPLVGLIRPTPDRLGGRGLWFVRQLCDLVQIRSTPEHGTCVRLWLDEPTPFEPR
jgi:anti-sigma regulatory factor (Ser/Thr protein kinase)